MYSLYAYVNNRVPSIHHPSTIQSPSIRTFRLFNPCIHSQFLVQGDDGNKKRVGTANGIATSMQMLGIGICNIIVGAMYDANKQGPDTPPDAKGWEPIMLFFAAMSVGAFACAVLLKV